MEKLQSLKTTLLTQSSQENQFVDNNHNLKELDEPTQFS